MENIIWIIGALVAIWGIAVLFQPNWMKNLIGWFSKGRMAYLAAAVKTLVGILFLIFARECRIPWILLTIGLLTAGGSILFCGLPFAKIQAYLKWWQNRPLWLYRVWGLMAAVFGGLILYAGTPAV